MAEVDLPGKRGRVARCGPEMEEVRCAGFGPGLFEHSDKADLLVHNALDHLSQIAKFRRIHEKS